MYDPNLDPSIKTLTAEKTFEPYQMAKNVCLILFLCFLYVENGARSDPFGIFSRIITFIFSSAAIT